MTPERNPPPVAQEEMPPIADVDASISPGFMWTYCEKEPIPEADAPDKNPTPKLPPPNEDMIPLFNPCAPARQSSNPVLDITPALPNAEKAEPMPYVPADESRLMPPAF